MGSILTLFVALVVLMALAVPVVLGLLTLLEIYHTGYVDGRHDGGLPSA
ncbi:hypothetical protein JCM17960_01010 [Magnetospira thiophila]